MKFHLSEDKIYQDQVSVLVHYSENVDQLSLKRHLCNIEVTMCIGKTRHQIQGPDAE